MTMYGKFAAMLGISYVLMFLLSMSMIDEWDHFHVNMANAWMALVMVAPMGLVMLLMMWKMFPNTALNVGLVALFVVVFVGALSLGRAGALVDDDQFLRSMIPHHSRAILMCQEADITEQEIEGLCGEIITAQRKEIGEMELLLGQDPE